MIYLQLFWSFLQIGLFSFGGGYAAMPLIQGQVVTSHGWLTMSEFTDLITISQMTPGPIAVNSATFVGLKIAGIPGAISEHGYASRCITFASTSGGGNDRFGRSPDSYNSLLGKWNRNIPIWNKMDHDSDIRNMYIAAA